MREDIQICGVETNNLKKIDVRLKKKAINLIIGPSGSGKSSLAYDTIAQIGQHEYMSMFANDILEPSYKVSGYSHMSATVPIKQLNYNTNLHSTIGTYFGLNRVISLMYSTVLGLPEELFVLNKEENLCPECHGLGFISLLDPNRIINYSTPLCKNPFRCWNRYKDFYSQIISKYCLDSKIDSAKTFRDLSEEEKNLLLYGESPVKYSIKYKRTNGHSSRTTKYYGVLTGKPMFPNMSISRQYYSDVVCDSCKGKKYAQEYESYQINEVSIGQFMITPFSELRIIVDSLLHDKKIQKDVTFSLIKIRAFIEKSIELGLGHLCFHRSIPTLSGGELQRLRLVQVFLTQLSDLVIVLDEPLAGLSGIDKDSVFDNIVSLSQDHTIVVVDHNEDFVKVAGNIIALGEGSGVNGGNIINAENYLSIERLHREFSVIPCSHKEHICLTSKVYQFSGVDINIGEKCMNLLAGRSGVGKSTLLREYLPQYYEQYLYINQKPLVGNKNSSVATAMDIFSLITKAFSSKFKKDYRFFSNLTGNAGVCPVCNGAGYIEFGYDARTKTHLECEACEGTGFNKELKKYKLDGKSIFDIWKLTINEGLSYFEKVDKKIVKKLSLASDLLLGHLQIGQPTSTLSGGENIRMKLLKADITTSTVIGIDEPFKGLSPSEIYHVALHLNDLCRKGKTILIADHSEGIEQYFACCNCLINRKGVIVCKP